MLERLRAADAPLTFSELRVALGEPPAARARTRLRELSSAATSSVAGAGGAVTRIYVPRER